jgi:hypothetical protein
MRPHVDFLGVLFVVWGLLTTIVGLSTIALGVGAVSLIASATRSGGGQFAVEVTAAAFTILGLIAIVWGVAHVAIGMLLKRRTHSARMLTLMLGAVDLLMLPYGTALGCYALWVLLHEEGKKLFQPGLTDRLASPSA